jgi:hypothetical protein
MMSGMWKEPTPSPVVFGSAPPFESATDKTNPIVSAPALAGRTVWGLGGGFGNGSIWEREATMTCSVLLPDAPARSPALPRQRIAILQNEATALQPRQVLAARLLLAGMRVGEVAREICVCRHTIRRWMKDPAFAAEVRLQAARQPLPPRRKKPRSL